MMRHVHVLRLDQQVLLYSTEEAAAEDQRRLRQQYQERWEQSTLSVADSPRF